VFAKFGIIPAILPVLFENPPGASLEGGEVPDCGSNLRMTGLISLFVGSEIGTPGCPRTESRASLN